MNLKTTLAIIPTVALSFYCFTSSSPAFADTSYQPYYVNDGSTTASYAPTSQEIVAPTLATRGPNYVDPGLQNAQTTPNNTDANYKTTFASGETTASYAPTSQEIVAPTVATRGPNYVDPSLQKVQTADAPAKDPKNPKLKLLETHSGVDLGLQWSAYHYREPDLEVSLVGLKYGFTAEMTSPHFWSDYFVKADVRYAAGDSNYHGSGGDDDQFEDLADLRALFGRDFLFKKTDLTPFVGIAYRHLYSDDRGISTIGAAGYRRENDLFYVPFGVTGRFALDAVTRVSTTIEYDQVISGTQTSQLSDAGQGYPDISNHQSSGRGYRGEVMFEWSNWAVGPFASYWNINQSDTVSACGSAVCFAGDEPHNETFEAGVQLKYHIFSF